MFRSLNRYVCVVLVYLIGAADSRGIASCEKPSTALDLLRTINDASLFSLGLTILEIETLFQQQDPQFTILVPSDKVFQEAFGGDGLPRLLMDSPEVAQIVKSIYEYHIIPQLFIEKQLRSLPDGQQLQSLLPNSNITLANNQKEVKFRGMEGGEAAIVKHVTNSCSISIFVIDNILLPVQVRNYYNSKDYTIQKEEDLISLYQKRVYTMNDLNEMLWDLLEPNSTEVDDVQSEGSFDVGMQQSNSMNILIEYIEKRLNESNLSEDELIVLDGVDLNDLGPLTEMFEEVAQQWGQSQEFNFEGIPFSEEADTLLLEETDVLESSYERPGLLNYSEDLIIEDYVQDQNPASVKDKNAGVQHLTLVKSPNFEWWRENIIKAPPPPPPSPPQVDIPDWDIQDLVQLGLVLGSPAPDSPKQLSPTVEEENLQIQAFIDESSYVTVTLPTSLDTYEITSPAVSTQQLYPQTQPVIDQEPYMTMALPVSSGDYFPTITLSSYSPMHQQPLNQPFSQSSIASLGTVERQILKSSSSPTLPNPLQKTSSNDSTSTNVSPLSIDSPSYDQQIMDGFADMLSQFLPVSSPLAFPFQEFENSTDPLASPLNTLIPIESSSAVTSGPSPTTPEVQNGCENKSALDIISVIPELSALRLAIVYNQMENYFSDLSKSVTIFAPTNEAFLELGRQHTEGLLPNEDTNLNIFEDVNVMSTVLGYHVVPALALTYKKLQDMGEEVLSTMGGASSISLMPWQEIVLLKGEGNIAAVVERDVGDGCNVALHIIDSVLLPFKIQGESPSMEFSSLRRSATPAIASEEASSQSEERACTSLTSMLSQQPELALYHQLLEDSGLSDLIQGRSDLTVFAPNDAAMGQVMDAVRATGGITQATWQLLLAYHIVQGDWHKDALVDGTTLPTLSSDLTGTPFQLTARSDGLITQIEGLSNTVNIVGANRYACGAMIHIIDGVLIPITL